MAKSKKSSKINKLPKKKDILSLSQFSQKDLLKLFKAADKMKTVTKKKGGILKGKIVTLLFYEPSSRTFGSFASAIKRLGGDTIDVLNPQVFSSVSKGETLEDTVQVFASYSDAIVIRHFEVGAAKRAADACSVPVLNAGDGIGEHPTQALLDLYTIYSRFLRLDGLTGVVAGDLLNGRTVHSLLKGLSKFKNNSFYLLSPKQLKLSRSDFNAFKQSGLKLVEIENEKDIPTTANFWYWTRVQKERFKNMKTYEKVKNRFVVTKKVLGLYGNKNMILMHPLPRVGEITTEVDSDKRAIYLKEQVKNGVYIRMALLVNILT